MKNKISLNKISMSALLMLVGIVSTAFGIAIFYSAALGSSPAATLGDGIHNVFKVSYGTGSLIGNVIFFSAVFFLDKKQIEIGTIVFPAFLGVFIDIATNAIAFADISQQVMIIRIVAVLVGTIIMAFGLGIYVACDFGKGPLEGIAHILQQKTKLKYEYLRPILDLFITVIGFLLGGKVGLGTVVVILLTGYVMQITMKKFKFIGEKLKSLK